MMPIAPLMIEHRLIERLIAILKIHNDSVPSASDIDLSLIDSAVGFLRNYADRSHHGKEEDILFVSLNQKDLTNSEKQILKELVEEHSIARNSVSALASALDQAQKGENKAYDDIVQIIHKITQLYPVHIEKEDKQFFIPVMKYYTQKEQEEMLQQFEIFDQHINQKKYLELVEHYEENDAKEESLIKMKYASGVYECTICGYNYVPENGDTDHGIPPGTRFEDLPDDWVCPVCGAEKELFKKK